jgi:hypothetical protein
MFLFSKSPRPTLEPSASVGAGNISSGSERMICEAYQSLRGHAMAQLVEALRYKPKGREFDSRLVLLEFFIDIILPSALWPWG